MIDKRKLVGQLLTVRGMWRRHTSRKVKKVFLVLDVWKHTGYADDPTTPYIGIKVVGPTGIVSEIDLEAGEVKDLLTMGTTRHSWDSNVYEIFTRFSE